MIHSEFRDEYLTSLNINNNFTFDNNIKGPLSLKLNVNNGQTKLSKLVDVYEVNIANDASLLGNATFQSTNKNNKVLNFNNEGHVYANSEENAPSIIGNYKQSETGYLHLGFADTGKITPLNVSGTAELASNIALSPRKGYYEDKQKLQLVGDYTSATTTTTSSETTVHTTDADGTNNNLNIIADNADNNSSLLNYQIENNSEGTFATFSRDSNAYYNLSSNNELAKKFATSKPLNEEAKELYAALDFANTDDKNGFTKTFNQLSGSIYQDHVRSVFALNKSMSHLFSLGHEDANIWFSAYGGSLREKDNGSSYRTNVVGVAGGMSAKQENNTTIGFDLAVGSYSTKNNYQDKSKGQSLFVNGFTKYRNNYIAGETSLTFGYLNGEVTRKVVASDFSASNSADTRDYNVTFNQKLGHEFKANDTFAITPYAALTGTVLHSKTKAESGSAAIKLNNSSRNYKSVTGSLGIKAKQSVKIATIGLDASYNRELMNKAGDYKSNLTSISDGKFSKAVNWYGRDSFNIDAYTKFDINNFKLKANVETAIKPNHGASVLGGLTLEYNF